MALTSNCDNTIILLRLDDICETMDRDKFHKMKELLDRYGIKPLIGVIPLNKDSSLNRMEPDPDYIDMLRECVANGWTIAMHGVHHIYDSSKVGIITKRRKSEFAGKKIEEQINLLETGKQKMIEYGLNTDIFFAPGHSYDKNTIKALKQTGFKYISDGRTHMKYRWLEMEFIPLKYFSSNVPPRRGITTLCFHTNNMDDKMFKRTEHYIKRNNGLIGTFKDVIDASLYQKTWCARIEEELFVFYEYRIHPILKWIKRKLI